MAYTANTGFRYYRDVKGNTASPTPIPVRIANSATIRVGDLVRVNTAGFLVGAGVGAPVAGVLVGFRNQNGTNPFSLGYNTGSSGITLTGDDTLATSATNQTRAEYILGEVIMDFSGEMLWRNKADASQAQTNLLQFFDADSNNRQVTQSTASDSNGVLQLIVIDPEGTTIEPNNPGSADATIGLYRINENQFSMGIDTGTAKNSA